jgi:hypothetical protein
MPLEAVVTCIGTSLRDDLADRLEELDPGVRGIAMQLLDALPSCANDQPIGIRIQEVAGPVPARRNKRKLSAYNQHMSQCLKAGGTFATCVQEWREIKARGGG